MKKTDFLAWPVPVSELDIADEFQRATFLIVESLAGKGRIFVPGRRSTPLQVRKFNQEMVVYALQALIDYGWKLEPQKMVGISILTEGAGVPFFEAFAGVWPGKEVGGLLHLWARRELAEKKDPSQRLAHFKACLKGQDRIPPESFSQEWVGVIFDIGATGATLKVIIPKIAQQFERLIFASPCTSPQAAVSFVKIATACGLPPENLAVVAMEGFFGLHANGTFLSLQLPGTITSSGNEVLSRLVFPQPDFCHIGAGGLAANWPFAYQAELKKDERCFGRLDRFESLQELMNHAGGLRWPNDFGSPF